MPIPRQRFPVKSLFNNWSTLPCHCSPNAVNPDLTERAKVRLLKLKGDHFEISKNTGPNLRFQVQNGDQRYN